MNLNHQKMNKLHQIAFRVLPAICLLYGMAAGAQTQKKTYSESFNVGDNTVLNINTSHTDIEFDTWNKNQVLVEAVIELEGATEEEAEKYFKNNPIKILGNSSEIEVSTRNSRSWHSAHISGVPGYTDDIVVEIPDAPYVEPFFLDIEIPELPEIPELAAMPPLPPMPPVPSMKHGQFDYQEYQERGEAYLKEWSESFREGFDEEWAEQMEEWGEQYRTNMEEFKIQQEEQRAEREAMREELREEREEMRQQAEEMREEAREERARAREEMRIAREEQREVQRSVIISSDKASAPKIYYHSSDGKSGKFEVKRSIKIKMPKSVKLKMNVRYGEIKLAENTKDINATLSYARLHATTIDGDKTNIVAAYSPVVVQEWNVGKLNTKFSGEIALKDVKYLTLDATSSEVTIDRLFNSAKVRNNLGSLYIRSVAPEFSDMDISVQNGQLECKLPDTAYKITAQGMYSSFSFPKELTLNKSDDQYKTVHKGYHLADNSDKVIIINSNYSDVKLQD